MKVRSDKYVLVLQESVNSLSNYYTANVDNAIPCFSLGQGLDI